MVGSGVAMFGALLISGLLMQVFGAPILASVPSGTWGLDWLAATVTWLGTADALFWWLAAATLLLAVVAWRSSWLTRTASVVSTITLTTGVAAGVAYRITHVEALASSLVSDPAFWFLVSGGLAPFALWALRAPTLVAIEAIFDGLEKQHEQRAQKQLAAPTLTKRPPDSATPPANA
ncbi:MAG: hypothetical protein ABIT21_08415 [Terrimesophilobacter sp.]